MESLLSSQRAASGHLTIRNLSKEYQDHRAVAGIDLEVGAGEFVALLGPSGCGKSTLLRCIAGLVAPTGGDILVDGESILARPVHKRDLGMVFQSYALFPHLSVVQNVAFGLRMRGVAAKDAQERAAEALGMVRMGALGHRMPSELSGGQQQRVAFARAIVTRPTVLLLDEPFSALDAKLREAMQVEVRQLQRRLNITTIFVTHDQHEAMSTADRIAIMNAGRVEQYDSPTASYNTPRTLFVADFVGRMNRVTAQVTGSSADKLELGFGHSMSGHAAPREELEVGDEVHAVLRPEKTLLTKVPAGVSDAPVHGLRGRVREIVFGGERLSIHVDTPVGEILACEQNRPGAMQAVFQPGQDVVVRWRTEDLMVFCKE
jgi:putative spermidine/putrescine transport system ATP-binding protein